MWQDCERNSSMADIDILRAAGQVAGIGGLAIGALIIVFKEVIRKNIFPNLTKQNAYRLLRLIVVLVFFLAISGIVAWIYVNIASNSVSTSKEAETHPLTKPPLPDSNDKIEVLSNECGQQGYAVTLFKYHGSEQGELSIAFNQFQGIIKDKIVALVQEIKASNSNCFYLDKLHLCYINQYSPSSYDSILQYWNSNSKSILEILTGTIFSKEGTVIVGSRAYFNDAIEYHKSQTNLKTMNFELRVSPDEFGATRDLHSLITLYILAIDAKRSKLSNDIIAEYLSKAFTLSKDLGRDDLRVLIEKELATLQENRS